MCGITAIYGVEQDRDKRLDLLLGMMASLEHRGPDGSGYYISPEIALGQTRLSIVDLSTGDQPMVSGENVIIFNGEIYNYIELKEELRLKGVKFKSTCDTEVLLKAFEYFGEECFAKLNGQFSVLIWNKVRKELTIARDRFGVRPLYLLNYCGTIYFASELKAFDQIPGFQREFDPGRLYEHSLLWNTYGDHTVFKGIRSVPGGTYEVYKDGRLVKGKRFYDIGQTRGMEFTCLGEAQEAFRWLMKDSVKLRLRSDVPVGAYLSGGIDSSVILSLINNCTSKQFKTFSITFEDSEYDESSYQKDMVSYINCEHHALNITYKKIDEAFPDAVYHFERPVFRTAPVPLYLLSEIVRQNDIKVVLTGEGADEILWGYDSYKELKLLDFWAKYPDSRIRPLLIKKLYPHLSHYKDESQYGMMKMFYEGFLSDYNNDLVSLNIRIHNNRILQNYFSGDFNIAFNKDRLINEIKSCLPSNYDEFSLLQKNQYLEMRTLLSGYLLSSQGDRMSMAHSVEGRYPFLDHRVVDMLFNMKDEYKLNGFKQKFLLKSSYQNDIPESILNRPKRPYMSPDLRSFFNGGKLTGNAAFFLSEDLLDDYGIFNTRWVHRFIKKFNEGVPASIGYRDNMIITFILSAQIANYWIKNPKKVNLAGNSITIKVNDYERASC